MNLIHQKITTGEAVKKKDPLIKILKLDFIKNNQRFFHTYQHIRNGRNNKECIQMGNEIKKAFGYSDSTYIGDVLFHFNRLYRNSDFYKP